MPGVSKEPEEPKDHNHDPFYRYFLAKLAENVKNHKKKIGIFQWFLLILKVFMQFIQFWVKTSGKTDHGCDS